MKKRVLEAIMAALLLISVASNVKYAIAEDGRKICIAIDPGHGGFDPGKISVNGDQEKCVNLAISLKLKEKLEKAGYEVVLTRSDDNSLAAKKSDDMKKRCAIINQKADIAISIHANSFEKESARGAQVFYHKSSQEGKELATYLQKSFLTNVDSTNGRQISANDSYYMLKNTKCPLVIVECGFLSNSTEAKLLCTESYQDKIANAVCLGIEEYLNRKSEPKSGDSNTKNRLYEY